MNASRLVNPQTPGDFRLALLVQCACLLTVVIGFYDLGHARACATGATEATDSPDPSPVESVAPEVQL